MGDEFEYKKTGVIFKKIEFESLEKEDFAPTNITYYILVVFIIFSITEGISQFNITEGISQFNITDFTAGDFQNKSISAGYPFKFFEYKLAERTEQPFNLVSLIADLIIYMIVAYIINVLINILKKLFFKSAFNFKKPTTDLYNPNLNKRIVEIE